MGFKTRALPLELPGYQEEDDPRDNLVVHALLPSVNEGALINAGRSTITESDGTTREETSEEYQRRVFGYMVPKIRSWTLEDEHGVPIPVPREAHPGTDPEAKTLQLKHLYEQDENIVLAVYHAWRLAGLPKKADSDEGKDSATPSTDGPDASPPSGSWDVRELESQIPMG